MCEVITATLGSLFAASAASGAAGAGAAAAGAAAATTAAAGTAAAAGGAAAAAASTMPAWLGYAGLASGVLGTGASVMGQMQAADAAKSQAQYQAAVAKNNAALAEQQGEAQAQQVYRAGAGKLGMQRAALAANNVDIGYGTALDLQRDTATTTALDAATARFNGLVAGNAQRDQGTLALSQGRAAEAAMPMAVGGTVLNGASQFAGRWASWQRGGWTA